MIKILTRLNDIRSFFFLHFIFISIILVAPPPPKKKTFSDDFTIYIIILYCILDQVIVYRVAKRYNYFDTCYLRKISFLFKMLRWIEMRIYLTLCLAPDTCIFTMNTVVASYPIVRAVKDTRFVPVTLHIVQENISRSLPKICAAERRRPNISIPETPARQPWRPWGPTRSSQTVPQLPLCSTSTLPSQGELPPTSRYVWKEQLH